MSTPPQDPLIILGVDPGSRASGYALLSLAGSVYTALEYGVIRPADTELLTQRYTEIFREICLILDTFSPHVVAVEAQFVQKNVQSALKLGRAQAMILLAATLRNIPIFEYQPTHVKQAVVGHGLASKEQVRHMVKMLLKLSSLPSNDAADAIAIAMCHGHRLNHITPSCRI